MKFILAEKIEMTQRFSDDGRALPVTVVQAGPCVVTQVKTAEHDGYTALQVGFGTTKRLSKPIRGHLKELGTFRYLREFRLEGVADIHRGDRLTATNFVPGDIVQVSGTSKGKGFQGVVRRHGFGGSPASHGHKDQLRMPGSIGSTDTQRVVKGRRMAGHMGSQAATVKNLTVIEVDQANGWLYLKGAVPGARHSLLLIAGAGEMKFERAEPTSEKTTAPKEQTPSTKSDKKTPNSK